MELDIKKLDEIWTSDEKKLGLAQAVFHRLEGVNPALEYYAAYLEIENFELGDDFYVPTDKIEGRDPKTGRIELEVTMKQVMNNTWSRLPNFVVHGNVRKEALPDR